MLAYGYEVEGSPEALAAQAGTEEAEYSTKVESTAYSMKDAQLVVSQAGAQITWDDVTKQNYATWESEGSTYKVWLEDAKSLQPRLQLMKDYGLAGTAAWRLGQETSDIWDVILQYTN